MKNNCQVEPSIVRDWAKVREWELLLLAQRGYEKAQREVIRRAGGQVYQMPDGDWAVAVCGTIQDGFESLGAASFKGWRSVRAQEIRAQKGGDVLA